MRKGCCRHFTGVADKCCAVGVNYDDITTVNGEQFALALPCYTPRSGRSADPRPKASCDKYQEPTAEEIAAHQAELDASMERFKKTLPIIAKVKQEHQGQNWKGIEACPVCGGKLHMTHAASNGHVWGKCETDNCLAWME